jgi:hypothetical protein
LTGSLPGEAPVLRTISDGTYFSPMRPDEYSITVSAQGYSSLKDSVIIPEVVNYNSEKDYYLKPVRSLSHLMLLLE